MTESWLLIPHGFGTIAFVGAFAAMSVAGTNRSDPDRWLGVAGYGFSTIAIVTTLFLFPYSTATRNQWVVFAAHFVFLLILAGLAVAWIAFHLA
jgi:hypothetical protein